MPARDGTGPYRTGPVGRGLGPCAGSDVDGEGGGPAAMGMARRWGRRFGFGRRGWGRGGNGEEPVVDEATSLLNRQNWLQAQLDAVSHEIERRRERSG